jgi:hypothetical protein
MPLSAAKAATIAGVSRSLVSKALAAGALVGVKRNSGHWSIMEEDLAAWMGQAITRAESHAAAPEPHPELVDPTGLEALQAELRAATTAGQEAREGLAAANARLDAMGEIISNLKADRDAWQGQAEVLSLRSGGFLARIFRRL